MLAKKIFILDDNADLLEIMDYLLTESGYDTLAVENGEHVYEQIDDFKPDLILMDIMLGNLDGRKICQVIKANALYLMPVILISGTHYLKEDMFKIGSPDDYLEKPFDIDNLLKKISFQLMAKA